MTALNDTFTSTGHKFFAHQEAMQGLRDGRGRPVVTHVMLTDVCNHSCAFCSVQARAGDHLRFGDVMDYLTILQRYGLKAVILSGGGNPILYKDQDAGGTYTFNHVVDAIHARGLEIGLITNGMPLREYQVKEKVTSRYVRRASGSQEMFESRSDIGTIRESWGTVKPSTLDKLTWVRISMSGLDHPEREVYVPDVDPAKTTLGFSYVAHDVYYAPEDHHHGKVSTSLDLTKLGVGSIEGRKQWWFEDRIDELTEQICHYVKTYHPRYVRLLPNCLEPGLIQQRCEQLRKMADAIDPSVAFVQYKPPAAPKACYLGYVHPVLNCDGYVLPCDSCCLNESAGHKLGEPWRICHWSEIADLYDKPVRSLIGNPSAMCPGCVFTHSNEILGSVVDGTADLTPLPMVPEHVNFV